MIFLLGPRYKTEMGNQFKIVCKQFMTFQENYLRALEQFREIYWESLRAPADCVTLDRNPYRREKLIKKLYGKTKAERKETMKTLNNSLEEHKK